jgi:hypothetical protein
MGNKDKSFIFYHDFKFILNFLTQAEKGDLIDGIILYSETGETPLNFSEKTENAFLYIKNRIDDNISKRETLRKNASKGGNPNFKKGKSNPYYDNQNITKDNQEITKTLPKDNLNINANANVKANINANAKDIKPPNPLFKKGDKKILKEKPINEIALKLARLLNKLILIHNPLFKIKREHGLNWAKDIEKINHIDGYSYFLIEEVIKWAQNDDFWKKNILSGAKLRKQFNTLTSKMDAKKAMASEQRKIKEVEQQRNYEEVMAEKNKNTGILSKINSAARKIKEPKKVGSKEYRNEQLKKHHENIVNKAKTLD